MAEGLLEAGLAFFGLLKEESGLEGPCREFRVPTECDRVGLVAFLLGLCEGRGLIKGSCICTSSSNMGRKVEEKEMAGGGRLVTGLLFCSSKMSKASGFLFLACCCSKMPLKPPALDLAVVVDAAAVCCSS